MASMIAKTFQSATDSILNFLALGMTHKQDNPLLLYSSA